MYFSLHNHTDYSNALLGFSDSTNKVSDLIQYAYDIGLNGLCITDHEGISAHIQALNYYNKMQKDRPFTLGLGNEIYLMEEFEDEANKEQNNTYPYYHFILIALDTEGHKQIRELSTRAWKRAWKQGRTFRRPTYYNDLLEIISPNRGHVVGLSACLGSRIDKALLEDDFDTAFTEVERLKVIFGEENFYLEVQPAKDETTDQFIVNKKLFDVADRTSTPVVVTTDSHYLKKEDALIHKVFLNSQDGDREVDDFYATAYMMDVQELSDYLNKQFKPDITSKMLSTSNEIMARINVYDIYHDPIIPEVPLKFIPNFKASHTFSEYYDKYKAFGYYANIKDDKKLEYFFYQIESALKAKVVDKGKDIEKYIARLDEEWEELKIISEQLHTKMPCYYQTMSYIIDLIWEAGSLAMPARGSAAGFLTCYLLEVTQIDPVPLGDYFPSWRHLNHQRGVELPDIDNDSEASKKLAIVNKMKEFFGEDHVLNVATFSKITSKTAIEKACKGLGIDDTEANYLKSLVPVNRGKIADLKTCIYGGKDGSAPVHTLVSEMKKFDRLIDCCFGIEGLIANRGTHAAGVVVSNEPYIEYISAMRSADGTLETCYDLWDSEASGLIKFDMLTVNAADKIHKTMDLLLEHGKITWEGSLKKTYYKWVHPDVLEYNNKEMWDTIPKIYSIFQFDTPVSQKALGATNPHSVMDLSACNSLLRLMPDSDEAPVDRYKRYKESHDAWVKDTTDFGLNDEERSILWTYLSDAYGLADSQEKIMRLSMDEKVAGYTLKEANKLRKSIAKKDQKLQEEAKQLFFECCERQGTRDVFADYIWNVVFAASFGYSFSQLHSYSYSIIALQELNLNFFYHPVFWNCACLTIEASGIEKDEDDKSGAVDYGEVAKAIYKMKQSNIEVSPPDINESDANFTPIEEDNKILYGLSGISGINADITTQIIENRPYTSFRDFLDKNLYKGSLITASKIKTLIYGGCFDCFNPNRISVMKQYISYDTSAVESLTMANMGSIKACGVAIPKEIVAPYNFYKYATAKERLYGNHPTAKSKKLYWLNDKGKGYFTKNLMSQLKEEVDYWYENDMLIVVDKSIEKALKPSLDALKQYINTDDFKVEYRKCIMRQKYMEFIDECESTEHWSFSALSYYSHNHELYNLDYDRYLLTKFCELPEEPNFVEMTTRGRTWRRYEINAICGTILEANKNKHIVTILTPEDDVVNCKFNAEHFAYYTRQIADGDFVEKPWIKRGNLVIFTGYRRGENEFAVKRYKNTIYNSSVKLIHSVNDDGTAVIQSKRYGEEEEDG